MTDRIIGFAHRGAALVKQEQNTLPAFQRALDQGANGLETDIALTVDGAPILLHTGIQLRRSLSISQLRYDQLPSHIPSLANLYRRCGTGFELSLDMAQPRAAEAVVAVAEEFGALDRLWLTYWQLPTLESWRRQWPDLHLVYPTIPLFPGRAIRIIERLAEFQVTALNLHHRIYSAHVVEQARARGLLVFAWGLHNRGSLRRVLHCGTDGVFCDDVDVMVNEIQAVR